MNDLTLTFIYCEVYTTPDFEANNMELRVIDGTTKKVESFKERLKWHEMYSLEMSNKYPVVPDYELTSRSHTFHTVFECWGKPNEVLREFIIKINNQFKSTNIPAFVADYIKIFKLKPDADIITELI